MLILEHLSMRCFSKNLDAVVGSGVDGEGRAIVFDTSTRARVRRQLAKFDEDHISALFRTRQLAWSTGLTTTVWGAFVAFVRCSIRDLRTQ